MVCIWDIRKPTQPLAVLQGSKTESSVTALAMYTAFSETAHKFEKGAKEKSGQQLLICGTADGFLTQWDLATLHETNFYQAHSGRINSIAYSPFSHQIATASADGIVKVWQAGQLELYTEFSEHQAEIKTVVPFRQYFVSGGCDSNAYVWKPVAQAPIVTTTKHGVKQQGGQGEIYAKEARELQRRCTLYRHVITQHVAPVCAICAISDKVLATASWDTTICCLTWH